MAFNVTNQQFKSILQTIQNRYIRIELLNYQFQTVDEISGVVTAGNIQCDADADVRRTGDITMVVTDSSFEVESGNRVWLDRYLKVWIGIEELVGTDIVWTKCGIFIIDAPSYQYDLSTHTLQLSLLDLMAKMTEVRNGYLPGVPVILSAGENIRQAIIDTIKLAGFTKYIVEEAPGDGNIPMDLEFPQGSTVYDLLNGLNQIYPFHEIFFDVDGVFHYQSIPTGKEEPIIIDDTLFDNIVTKETLDTDFQNVKNVIEVYGRTHDPAHFSTETTVGGNTINLTIADVESYQTDMIYGFTLTDNPGYNNMQLKINNLTSYPIRMSDGVTSAEIVAESGQVYFCVQFKGEYWYWLGHLQAYGYAEDDNPQSPFYINSTVGQIRLPLFGGEYDNCLTDDLAQQRAERELYLHTNMNNTVTLSALAVPWLDVNIKVEYTLKTNNVKAEYLIKSFDFGLSVQDDMTIKIVQFYPDSV